MVQFPTFQSPFPVKNDNSQRNGKQIATEPQIITSCDVKRRRSPILYPHFKLCLCFSLFLCILLSHSFGFSVPKPQQLWEISPSCQHFDLIVECVNQAGARCAKSNSSHSLFQPPPSSFAGGFTLTVTQNRRNPGRYWPAHLIFVPSPQQTEHKSTGLFKTTCSGSLWIFLLLAVNTCMAAVGLLVCFQHSRWTQAASAERNRDSASLHTVGISPLEVLQGLRRRVHISVKHQTAVTNGMWIKNHSRLIHLSGQKEKKKAQSRLPLSPNSPYVLILVRPSRQTQACLAWVCFGPVLSYCAQMLKDQKGIKEKKSQTAWRNEEIASYYHGVFKRTVKKICPVYFPLSWNGKIFGSAFFYWNGAPWERKRKWSSVWGIA